MLTVSYTADEYLDLMLIEADAPDDTAIRMAAEGRGFDLGVDRVRPGDSTLYHGEKVVLVIDEQVSELLADSKLDVQGMGEESKLVLIELLEE